MRHFLFLIIFTISFFLSKGQTGVLDGVFIRENNFSKRPMAYNYESEAGVMWNKRVWRTLDLREKINHPYYYPLEPTRSMKNLITVLKDGVCSGDLTAFDPISDEFAYRFTSSEACSVGESIDTVWTTDENEDMIPTVIKESLPIYNIRRIRIKEEWYFNRHRSVMEARIIGVCPVEEVFDENGEYKGERPLYWFYMPELRPILANSPAPNPHSDVERRTYDDLFHKRKFSSYIMKESNVYDRAIRDYSKDLDALLEGKRIEEEIFTYEQDLWEY